MALADFIVLIIIEYIIILNTSLKVINATPSFIRFFNLDKASIIGKQLFDIVDGGLNNSKLRSLLDDTLTNHRYHSNFEIDYMHPQSGSRTLVVKPCRIYQPPNLLFSLEFEDLTDERALMEEKDIFITVASHEIKTPISIIKAYAQILERELKEAAPIVIRAVDKVNEQINYISSLISALLDTTKITTGKLMLDPEVFNLYTLVDEITEGFKITQSSHQIIIAKEVDGLVYADKLRTGSVTTNLLSNSVKYSPNGKQVIITVETDEQTIKVSVQDFGMGIPEAEQGFLFTRFGRTEAVKKTNIPGIGLGLHFSSEIIKLQNGTIGFTTQEGKGSTFYFTLPLY